MLPLSGAVSGRARHFLGRPVRVLNLALAPGLVLALPFTAFLKHQRYSYTWPETLVCVAIALSIILAAGGVSCLRAMRVLVLSAAITFLVDVQFASGASWMRGNQTPVLLVVFACLTVLLWLSRTVAVRLITIVAAAMLLATALFPSEPMHASGKVGGHGRADLPLVIHIIFDAHIGVEGLPEEGMSLPLREEVRDFFSANLFRLYGAAHSEHNFTEQSIAHLFNFRAGEYAPDLVQPGSSGFAYQLRENRYFAQMASRGYAVRAYDMEHVHLCPDSSASATCLSYAASAVNAIHDLPLPVMNKAMLLGGSFLGRSNLHNRANRVYTGARSWLARHDVSLPAWEWSFGMGPINSVAQVKRIAADLSHARHGDMFVAHLVIPHEPYVYDAGCQPLPPANWVNAGLARLPMTREARARRYARYADQVRCATRLVRDMLDAIPADLRRDTVMIVQGDHGSRLSFVSPSLATAQAMTTSDYSDTYSTLFAVRSPWLSVGYDTKFASINCLFSTLVASDFHSIADDAPCLSAPPIVFMPRNQSNATPVALPNFAAAPR